MLKRRKVKLSKSCGFNSFHSDAKIFLTYSINCDKVGLKYIRFMKHEDAFCVWEGIS